MHKHSKSDICQNMIYIPYNDQWSILFIRQKRRLPRQKIWYPIRVCTVFQYRLVLFHWRTIRNKKHVESNTYNYEVTSAFHSNRNSAQLYIPFKHQEGTESFSTQCQFESYADGLVLWNMLMVIELVKLVSEFRSKGITDDGFIISL